MRKPDNFCSCVFASLLKCRVTYIPSISISIINIIMIIMIMIIIIDNNIIIMIIMKNGRRKTPTNFMCANFRFYYNLLQALFNWHSLSICIMPPLPLSVSPPQDRAACQWQCHL